jgi:hypothetical protein
MVSCVHDVIVRHVTVVFPLAEVAHDCFFFSFPPFAVVDPAARLTTALPPYRQTLVEFGEMRSGERAPPRVTTTLDDDDAAAAAADVVVLEDETVGAVCVDS